MVATNEVNHGVGMMSTREFQEKCRKINRGDHNYIQETRVCGTLQCYPDGACKIIFQYEFRNFVRESFSI